MRNVVGVLLLLAFLSGCGGGGGSDGGGGGEPAASPLDKALSSGNSAGLDEQTLLEQALEEVARLETLQQELVAGLGISGPLRYPVSRNSHFIKPALVTARCCCVVVIRGTLLPVPWRLPGKEPPGSGSSSISPELTPLAWTHSRAAC